MKFVGLGVGLAAIAGTIWIGYGTYQVSAAADFDQSLGQVVNQVDRVGTSLNDAGTYVERHQYSYCPMVKTFVSLAICVTCQINTSC